MKTTVKSNTFQFRMVWNKEMLYCHCFSS